jgi:hypothetical protein
MDATVAGVSNTDAATDNFGATTEKDSWVRYPGMEYSYQSLLSWGSSTVSRYVAKMDVADKASDTDKNESGPWWDYQGKSYTRKVESKEKWYGNPIVIINYVPTGNGTSNTFYLNRWTTQSREPVYLLGVFKLDNASNPTDVSSANPGYFPANTTLQADMTGINGSCLCSVNPDAEGCEL